MANPSGPTTLQQLVQDYSSGNMPNEFNGINEGLKQGTDMAEKMLQRKVQVQKMGMDLQFKQKEFDKSVDDKLSDHFATIVKTDDSVARKALIDDYTASATKYNRPVPQALMDLMKSDDQRAKVGTILSTMGDPGDPTNKNLMLKALMDPNGPHMDTHDAMKSIDEWAKGAQQLAQTREMFKGKQSMQDAQQSMAAAKEAVKYSSPQDQGILMNKQMFGTPEWQAALARANQAHALVIERQNNLKEQGMAASTNLKNEQAKAIPEKLDQGQQKIEIQEKALDERAKARLQQMDKAAAKEAGGVVTKINSMDDVKSLRRASMLADNARALLNKPNVNFQDMSLAQKDMVLMAMRSNRPAMAADKSISIDSFDKAIDTWESYSSGGKSGSPPPAQLQQIKNAINTMYNTAREGHKVAFRTGLDQYVAAGTISSETADKVFDASFKAPSIQSSPGKQQDQSPAQKVIPDAVKKNMVQSADGTLHDQDSVKAQLQMALQSKDPDIRKRADAAYQKLFPPKGGK